LPPLSEEATTTVTLTLELNDNTTITKTINIIRTAIELTYFEETNTVKAGYVAHKAYLYNNQPHNNEIFDAYLQVMLYRDNKVVEYKQIQIDDEDFINNLEEDSGAMESFSDKGIEIFKGEIEGVNKISVFLTNGPIDFNSDVLPSIEFGIGSGVILEWVND
jgi:hypothetical protein